jgi:hypothetical protein
MELVGCAAQLAEEGRVICVWSNKREIDSKADIHGFHKWIFGKAIISDKHVFHGRCSTNALNRDYWIQNPE